MELTKLLDEERAVSPVIGVILMVAITVILAAVIGTFVLGLGGQVSESAPQAQFTFDSTNSSGTAIINITHDGGDGISADELSANVDGTVMWNSSGDQNNWNNSSDWSGEVTAGDSLDLSKDSGDRPSDGDSVRIIWSSSNSDKTATIGRTEFQA